MFSGLELGFLSLFFGCTEEEGGGDCDGDWLGSAQALTAGRGRGDRERETAGRGGDRTQDPERAALPEAFLLSKQVLVFSALSQLTKTRVQAQSTLGGAGRLPHSPSWSLRPRDGE